MNSNGQTTLTLKELSILLKKARKTKEKEVGKRITHKMIGDAIGVDRVTVGMWERGERYPGFLNVLNYCNFLGITPDELIGLKKPPLTLYIGFIEEERDTIFRMFDECEREQEIHNLHNKLFLLKQYIKGFFSRASTKGGQ
jgi:transcriptional regulator with XRE-family HTH domain